MSEQYTPSDDPRFTAYALGELDAAERAEVERLLEQHPESLAVVEQVRDIAGQLTRELQREPALALPAGARAAIEAQAAVITVAPRATVWRRWSYTMTGVAASVAVTGGLLWLGSQPPQSQVSARFGALPASETASSMKRSLVVQSGVQAHSVESFHDGEQAQDAKLQLGQLQTHFAGDALPLSSESTVRARSASGRQSGQPDGGKDGAGLQRHFELEESRVAGGGLGGSKPAGAAGLGGLSDDYSRYGKGVANQPVKQAQPGAAPAGGPAPAAPAPATSSRTIDNPASYQLAEPAPQQRLAAAGKPASAAPADPSSARMPTVQSAAGGAGRGASRPESQDRRIKANVQDEAQPTPTTVLGASPIGNLGDVAKKLALSKGRGGSESAEGVREKLPAAELKTIDEVQKLERLRELKEESKRVEEELARRKLLRDRLDLQAAGNEAYDPIIENEFVVPYREQAISTFSADVDTASYSNVRRFLTQGQLPPPNAVRVEELVNYFKYDDPQPAGDRPFSVNLEVNGCPWEPTNKLVRIGLKGKEIHRDKRPPSNLVFLVDVSGSMADNNKLPLVKQGLKLLTNQMTEGDRVAIVTYSDRAVRRLESTRGDRRQPILDTIESLRAGGSTNGAGGIQMAYETAVGNLLKEGTNRVILCTDGDFNVGVSDDDQLVTMIKEKAKSGVFLSVFGFGMGNLKDAKLEKLADKGNGHYAYVDDLTEAKKVFVDEMSGTLVTIAKDVKIQVEFNPGRVGAYRLIGYENRVLAAQDFADDKKDAGEIGAGHSVTALYEVIPADKAPKPEVAGLKYQKFAVPQIDPANNELLTLRLRYKQPDGNKSEQIDFELADRSPEAKSRPSRDFEWSAAVAGFGLVLRDSQFKGQASLDLLTELALGSKGPDATGHRRELIDLIHRARVIQARELGLPIPPTETLPEKEAEKAAAVNGKYRELFRKIEVPTDAQTYGSFKDFGWWEGTTYAGQQDLPKGFWVYVHPHWYIWGATSDKK